MTLCECGCGQETRTGNRFIFNHHRNKMVSDIRKEYNIKTIEEALQCEELWDVGNGITYCSNCHKLLKSKGGLL